MTPLVLSLLAPAFAISLVLTAALIRLGHRLGTFDSAGVPGQIKAERRRVPNTGGVAIFWGTVLPLVAGLVAISAAGDGAWVPEAMRPYVAGAKSQAGTAAVLLGCLALLHAMGMIDDRKPLGPFGKLAVMLAPGVAIPLLTDTRLLTFLDAYVGGPWLSIILTALWLVAVTNAMNFIDNMDGLAGGIVVIAGGCFLGASLINGQWFIASVLTLLIGATLGFLVFNHPARKPARIFMGDGGSLVVGFLLAFLAVRITYVDDIEGARGGNWYAALMPLVVLAVPLYDFVSVTLLRLSQGKSPFVGDMQHLSHRIASRGLSKRHTVTIIHIATASTAITGIFLARLEPWQAVLAGVQVTLVLGLLALLEFAPHVRRLGTDKDAP
ncbi:MAG: undecaprenyl/decaprenyl-phosphate alpha-N-acetylglucosaminyl 1-phosphate transferase [Phycisphaeraceae bacterium]|nr:undecaprenyl/decaprenyl-phosphate alpha-N-acetylglucosaminyl 1-phosphate transferase [Phycisphaeraceae bacterium]